MEWYLATFVYQIIISGHSPQFDEQLRLIRAEEYEWAYEKANILGKLGECIFMNDKKEMVQWKFVNVINICCITPLDDSAEIYTSTRTPKNVNNYLKKIQTKASLQISLMKNEREAVI